MYAWYSPPRNLGLPPPLQRATDDQLVQWAGRLARLTPDRPPADTSTEVCVYLTQPRPQQRWLPRPQQRWLPRGNAMYHDAQPASSGTNFLDYIAEAHAPRNAQGWAPADLRGRQQDLDARRLSRGGQSIGVEFCVQGPLELYFVKSKSKSVVLDPDSHGEALPPYIYKHRRPAGGNLRPAPLGVSKRNSTKKAPK